MGDEEKVKLQPGRKDRRPVKSRKVSEIQTDKGGVTAVYCDVRGMFFTFVGEQDGKAHKLWFVEAKSLEELRKIAKDAWAEFDDAGDIERLIKITPSRYSNHGRWHNGLDVKSAAASVEFMRFERKKAPDGSYRARGFEEDCRPAFRSHPERDRSWGSWYAERETTLIPYTDEAWAALIDIHGRLLALDKAISRFTSTPEGVAQLVARGTALLTGPEIA